MELSGDHGIYWYYFGSILHGEMKGELDSWLPCPVCDSRQETSERKAILREMFSWLLLSREECNIDSDAPYLS